jgi:hypothetical protein
VRLGGEENAFCRPAGSTPKQLPWTTFNGIDPRPIYISRSIPNLLQWESHIRLSSYFKDQIVVRAVHPPNWDLIRAWSFHPKPKHIVLENQIILLECNYNDRERMIVRVDYKFNCDQWNGFLHPDTAKIWGAYMPSSSSLLELMISCKDQVDEMLDWQEDFVFKEIEASCAEGQIHKSYTRRLRLRQWGVDWEIDIDDVSDTNLGDSAVSQPIDDNLSWFSIT